MSVSWAASSVVHSCRKIGKMALAERPRRKTKSTHVNIVTALLGTVRIKLTDNPLYNAVHPSFTMIFLVVYMTPRRVWALTIPSEEASSANGRRWVCNRVRTTSCGYVVIDAVILAIAEQRRMRLLLRGTSGSFSEDKSNFPLVKCIP